MPKDKFVPMEVGVAMATGRIEFLQMLRGRISLGEGLPRDQLEGLVDLCQEYIEEHHRDLRRINRLKGVLNDMEGLVKAYYTFSRKAHETLKSMEDDTHGEDGEVVYPTEDED